MCEHIPFLILPVWQSSRELLGSCQSRERAVGQAAGPVSNHPPKRYERAVGLYAGPLSIRTIHRSDIRKPPDRPPGLRQTIRQSETRVSRRTHHAVYRAIRRATHCRGAAYDPALKPQPADAADTELNPLDYFAVNPLAVGELGRRVIGEVILV